MQVSKALENLKYPDISVFLDLAWPGTSPQRVHIKLVADTPLTRQFVTLFLGHTGLTYCNTKLRNWNKYYESGIVWGGGIRGQQAAAKQVLPPIQGSECGGTVNVKEGMVVASTNLSNAALITLFGLVFYYDGVCGHTESFYQLGSVDTGGQAVLWTAYTSNDNIMQVRVLDCGVLF